MQFILKEHLTDFLERQNISCENVQLPDAKLVAANIEVMMISEVPPKGS
ncbi:MAG: hypothetical protein ACOX8S_01855 [Christensenellales bacterium]|jgi:hypothetical protein